MCGYQKITHLNTILHFSAALTGWRCEFLSFSFCTYFCDDVLFGCLHWRAFIIFASLFLSHFCLHSLFSFFGSFDMFHFRQQTHIIQWLSFWISFSPSKKGPMWGVFFQYGFMSKVNYFLAQEGSLWKCYFKIENHGLLSFQIGNEQRHHILLLIRIWFRKSVMFF